MASPWWYRGRTWVFGAVYLGGFLIAGLYAGVFRHRYIPAFRELGARLGPDGALWLLAFAAGCAAVCYALRVWGSSYLRAGTVWNPDAKSDRFVIAGPFRFVRNPLYLGTIFLAIGIGLLAPVLGFAFIVIGNIVVVLALAAHEEVLLASVYGDRFRAYAARVPSLIPRIVPVAPEGDATPSLVQGLLAEVFTAALLLGILLTLADPHHGYLYFFVLYVAGIVAQRMIARRQQPA